MSIQEHLDPAGIYKDSRNWWVSKPMSRRFPGSRINLKLHRNLR